MDIKELKSLLDSYDKAYYDKDDPIISDEEYNYIKKQYLDLINNIEYDYVPGNALFNQVNHIYPIKSLYKYEISDQEKIRENIERLFPVVIQPKLDGLTLVKYTNSQEEKLKNDLYKFIILTRGNGLVGEDITANCVNIKGLGDINNISKYPVRMEGLMFHDDFDRINKNREKNGLQLLKNCRNGAAGLLRNLDSDKIDGITVIAYNLINSKLSQTEQISLLNKLGYKTIDCYEPKTVDDALDYINNYDRDSLDYDIDGLVVKSNKRDSLSIYGQTEHHPKDAFAIKFKSKGAWAILKDVLWTVGKEKVVPNAVFDEIYIDGSTISHATLNNIDYIKALDLHIGSKIYVIKSHDVIPSVVKSELGSKSIEIKEPIYCPVCNSLLEKRNNQLYCSNDNCKGRLVSKISLLASREAFNIEGLNTKTIDKILSYYNTITKVSTILLLNKESLLKIDGIAEKSAQKLYFNILKSRTISLDRFIYGSCIPLVGLKTARDIAEYYCNIDNFLDSYREGFKDINNIKDIGPEIKKSLILNFNNILDLLSFVQVIPMEKKSNKQELNKTVVITGTLSKTRKEIKDLLLEKGYNVTNSVSSNTDYLLIGSNPGDTKYNKAKKLNIKIIKEENLSEL